MSYWKEMEMWAVQEDKQIFSLQTEQFMGISKVGDIFLPPPQCS